LPAATRIIENLVAPHIFFPVVSPTQILGLFFLQIPGEKNSFGEGFDQWMEMEEDDER
jgi:hypothetical protein